MTKELLEVLKKLKKYTEIQSKRIDLLEKRLKELENKWLNYLYSVLFLA